MSAIAKAKPDSDLGGSDVFVAGLTFASQRLPDVEFLQIDGRDIPYVSEYDALGAFDVLEHIEEDERVLAQIHEALKPSGKLLLTVPQLGAGRTRNSPYHGAASNMHGDAVRSKYLVTRVTEPYRR